MKANSTAPKPCVYIITHLPTKRHYVGKANDYRARWAQHRDSARSGRGRVQYIAQAIRKYGLDQFQFAIAEEFETEDEAYEAEKWWIEFLRSDIYGFGFNRSSGGERGGLRRGRRSPELNELIASQRIDQEFDGSGEVHSTCFEEAMRHGKSTTMRAFWVDRAINLRFLGRHGPWAVIKSLPRSVGNSILSMERAHPSMKNMVISREKPKILLAIEKLSA